jgi:uncharacterized protein (DUF2164 family)
VAIELPKETKKALVFSIRKFFDTHMEEEIGELKAGLLLDFCLQEICPTAYNIAIRDAQKYFQERTADLDGVCYEPEMTFWKKKGVQRKG